MHARIALALAALSLAGCTVNLDAQRATVKEERTFTVSGAPDLVIETFDGAVEVRSWDKPQVLVVLEKQAESQDAARAIAVKLEQDGNRVSIVAPKPEGFQGVGINMVSRSVSVTVTMPRKGTVTAHSGDGAITLEGLDGRIEVKSGDGGITGRELSGELVGRTGDGAVSLDKIAGNVELNTGDGGVNVTGQLGKLSARTGDGAISVHALPGSRMDADWDLTSGDGAVSIALPDGFAADVDAHTGDGGITVDGLALPAPTGENHDTLRGSLGSGGKQLRVRTGDGGIRLRKG
jgi:hypothetical protein